MRYENKPRLSEIIPNNVVIPHICLLYTAQDKGPD